MFSSKEEHIIHLYLRGIKITNIRKETGCRRDKVLRVISEYNNTNKIPETLKRGRKSKLTNDVLLRIMALTISNRVQSNSKIAELLNDEGICKISPTTVNRGRHILKLNYKPPKQRQALSTIQKEKRIQFAFSILQSGIDVSRFIFSDESRFGLTPDNRYRWYRRGERDSSCYIELEKFNCSIMMYGAIGYNYKSKLVLCSGGVDSLEYRSLIEQSQMISDLDPRYGSGEYFFVQDGAPAHNATCSHLYLKKRCSFVKCWPPNSPDLNPIEHVWGAIKRIIKSKKIETKEELVQTVLEAWNSFPQDSINRLVMSFHGRLRTVIQENGESISDILRSNINLAPMFPLPHYENILNLNDIIETYDPNIDDNPISIRTKRPWTHEEVCLLMEKVKELGPKWTKIAQYFTDRTSISLRNKYISLLQ